MQRQQQQNQEPQRANLRGRRERRNWGGRKERKEGRKPHARRAPRYAALWPPKSLKWIGSPPQGRTVGRRRRRPASSLARSVQDTRVPRAWFPFSRLGRRPTGNSADGAALRDYLCVIERERSLRGRSPPDPDRSSSLPIIHWWQPHSHPYPHIVHARERASQRRGSEGGTTEEAARRTEESISGAADASWN